MKVSTAYSIVKELTPQQFVELYEMMGSDIQTISMPEDTGLTNEEAEIEERLIRNKILVLPYGRRKAEKSPRKNKARNKKGRP